MPLVNMSPNTLLISLLYASVKSFVMRRYVEESLNCLLDIIRKTELTAESVSRLADNVWSLSQAL